MRRLGRRLVAWWTGLDPRERVLYRAVVLLSIGGLLSWPPLAFFIPGVLFTLVFFDSFRRSV